MLKDNEILYSTDDQESETVVKVLFGGSFAGTNIYVDESDLEKAQELYQSVLESQPSFDDFEGFEEEE